VFVLVKVYALEETVNAEDSTDDLEDIRIGHIGHEEQDAKYYDRTTTVRPTQYIENFLQGVYHSRDHS
jgi:hypothetical protein